MPKSGASGDRAHAQPNPVGFITWFEPERVAAGTYIDRTFPEYVLRQEGAGAGSGGLLNLGDPDASRYIFDYLDAAVTEYGLNVLRIDYNIDPAAYWAAADGPNRTGLTEYSDVDSTCMGTISRSVPPPPPCAPRTMCSTVQVAPRAELDACNPIARPLLVLLGTSTSQGCTRCGTGSCPGTGNRDYHFLRDRNIRGTLRSLHMASHARRGLCYTW